MIEKGVSATDIAVIAEFLPGDTNGTYTSPWAGGNFSCISPDDEDTLRYDKVTYLLLNKLHQALGGRKSHLSQYPTKEFWEEIPSNAKVESLASYLKDFRVMEQKELMPGTKFGVSYITWNFNCPKFLVDMKIYLENVGVKFLRKHVEHISEAYISENTRIVFNCSGIGAKKLGGVKDEMVHPVRGQVALVKAPHIAENRMKWERNAATYIIPRPNSGGQVVLGGFVQRDNWFVGTYSEETEDILKRTKSLLPELEDGPFEILFVASGLRPYRDGGARIEREKLGNGRILVHNYGAGGYGYQAGYGMADHSTDLVLKAVLKI